MRIRLASLGAVAALALAAAPAQARFGVDVVTTATGHRVALADGSFQEVRWEAGGRSLLGVRDPGRDDEAFGLYRLAPGGRAAMLRPLDDAAAIAPDGSALASLAYTPRRAGAYVAQAVVRTRAGRTLARGFAHAAPDAGVISWSPDSRLVAVTEFLDDEQTATVAVAEAASGRIVERVAPRAGVAAVSDHVWSPDARYFGFEPGGRAGLDILDTATGDVAPLPGLRPGARVDVPAWSPDGRTVAVAQDDAVVLVDRATGLATRPSSLRGRVTALAFSPDGRRLAVGTTEAVRLYDLARGRASRVVALRGAEYPLQLAWAPDGRRLALVVADL